jgi:RHS repeat-associated protein
MLLRGMRGAGHRHVATYVSSTTYFDHADWLGTERARTGWAGNLCETVTSLPYGDGQNISTTCPEGDVSPMHFTGKERDTESGLDNFGARYDSSSMGRFMSPDPLLNSGKPWNPQTWNRYTYALNNPLAITDPTGLYDLVNNCATDNKKCNKQFQQHARDLKNALSNLQKQVNKMKDGPEKDRLEASLTVLGTQGDNNGVNVTFAALAPGTAGQTTFDVNPDTLHVNAANITLDPSQISGLNSYAIDTAYEGTHIEDLLTGLLSASGAFSLPQLSDFSTEYRGYETSAYAAQALGVPSLSFNGNVIWNQSWKAVDQQTLMDKGITRVVTGPPYNYQETTPHNPWPN